MKNYVRFYLCRSVARHSSWFFFIVRYALFFFPAILFAVSPTNNTPSIFASELEIAAEKIALKVRAEDKNIRLAVIDLFNHETQERDATTEMLEEQLTKFLAEKMPEQPEHPVRVVPYLEIVRLRLEWRHTFPEIQHDPLAENMAKLVNADWLVTGTHETTQELLTVRLQLYELTSGTLLWQTVVDTQTSSKKQGASDKEQKILELERIGEERTDISLPEIPLAPILQQEEVSKDRPNTESGFWSSLFSASPEEADLTAEIPEGMVQIPEGEFLMGSTVGEEDELPDHLVFLRSFLLDEHEVTNAEYSQCTECERGHGGFDTTEAQQPVVYVDWQNAATYCQFRNKRLPTEAEWEYAANEGQEARLKGQEELERYAWIKTNTAGIGNWGAQSVAAKRPNRWGVYDLQGNVMEWVQDYYAPDYFASVRQPLDPKGPQIPADTEYPLRVVRGGAWGGRHGAGTPSGVRAAKRYAFAEWTRSFQIGFRCARDIPETGTSGAD